MTVLVSPNIAMLWIALVFSAATIYLAFQLAPRWLYELRDSFSLLPISMRARFHSWSDRLWLVFFIVLVSIILPGMACSATAWIAKFLF